MRNKLFLAQLNAGSLVLYTIPDIQLGVGDSEFDKGLKLYEKGAVKKISDSFSGFRAIVSGTHEYHVGVSTEAYDRGICDCYVGQKNELCKHMIALAIAVVYKYRPKDTESIKHPVDQAVCSGIVRDATENELNKAKSEINKGMFFLKRFSGPSSKWFQYQSSLVKGSRIILLALSNLPVCEKSVMICTNTLKRLDKKACGGVDDSDGTVGDLLFKIILVLNMFVDFNPNIKTFIKKKLPKGEIFDWESGFYFKDENVKDSGIIN